MENKKLEDREFQVVKTEAPKEVDTIYSEKQLAGFIELFKAKSLDTTIEKTGSGNRNKYFTIEDINKHVSLVQNSIKAEYSVLVTHSIESIEMNADKTIGYKVIIRSTCLKSFNSYERKLTGLFYIPSYEIMKGSNSAFQLGASISYIKRYIYTLILNLAEVKEELDQMSSDKLRPVGEFSVPSANKKDIFADLPQTHF